MSSYRMKYKIGLVEHSIVVPEDISSIPLGTILPYSANTLNPPAGFLFCDGSAISRSMYPDLFALIGTLYGEGDGSTTFNLPNLVGKYPQGDTTAGTVKSAGLPNITGAFGFRSGAGGTVLGDFYGSGALTKVAQGVYHTPSYSTSTQTMYANISLDASRSSSIYGASDTVTPPTLTVRYIIKVFSTVSNESAIIDVSNITSDIATRMQRQQIPAFNKRIELTTSQSWSAPVHGWYKFTIKGGGGGGSSAYGNSSVKVSGGGGGEGGTTFAFEKLNQGDIVTITIGAGGSGGVTVSDYSSPGRGSDGGNSTLVVNSNIYVAGGGGGAHNDMGIGRFIGGSGTIKGNPGNYGIIGTSSQDGAVGGGPGFYAGEQGGGGHGGVYGGGSLYGNGYNGGNGYCWIEYFDPTL